MTPGDFVRVERLVRMSPRQLATALGYSMDTYSDIRGGRKALQPFLQYAIAWIMLYGPQEPYQPDKLGPVLQDTRKRLRLSPTAMAVLMGIDRRQIHRLEDQSQQHRRYLGYALAWIRLYGNRPPFPDQRATGLARCPSCGR